MKKKIIGIALLIFIIFVSILMKLQLNSNAEDYVNINNLVSALNDNTLAIGKTVKITTYSWKPRYFQCIEEGVNAAGTQTKKTVVSDILTINASNPLTIEIKNSSTYSESGQPSAAKLAIYAYLQNHFAFDQYGYCITSSPDDIGDFIRRRYISEILFDEVLSNKSDWNLKYIGRTNVTSNDKWFCKNSTYHGVKKVNGVWTMQTQTYTGLLDTTMDSLKRYINKYADLATKHKESGKDKLEITGELKNNKIVLDVPVKQEITKVYARKYIYAEGSTEGNKYESKGNMDLVSGIVFRIKPYNGNTLIPDFSIKSGNNTYKECTNLTGSIATELKSDAYEDIDETGESSANLDDFDITGTNGGGRYCFYTSNGDINGTIFTNWENGFEVVPNNSSDKVTKVVIEYGYILYGAKYAILDASTQAGGNCYQSECVFTGNKEVISGTTTIEIKDKLTIQKVTSNGNNLNRSGIKFNVYDDNYFSEKVGELTTNGTGKTESMEVSKKIYYIEETENTLYGYKGNEGTKKSVNTNSDSFDGTFLFDNTPSYGNIKIIKEDQNGVKLKDVKFILKITEGTTTKYLKIVDSSGNKVANVEKSITINKNNIANSTEYKVVYADSESDATTFKTDTEGIIEIENLEKYYCLKEYNSSTKRYTYTKKEYEYSAIEKSNSNYGFKADSNIVNAINIDLELVESPSTSNYGTVIKNNQNLVKVRLEKEDQAGNILGGVQFKIKIVHGDTTQYIRLKDSDGIKVDSITGYAVVNKHNEKKSGEYVVDYVSDEINATIFVTKTENGALQIDNLEKYFSKDVEYKYIAKEISNSNYGFNTSSNLSIEQNLKADENNTVTNTPELGNLKLVKVDENKGNKIPNTEFKIKAGSSFIKLLDENGSKKDKITGTVNISKTGKAYKQSEEITYYAIAKTTEADATTFVTDSNGEWVINNLEVYNGVNKITYTVIETVANSNYEKVDTVTTGTLVKDKTLYVIKTGFVEDVNATYGNTPKYTKIGGYVWEDIGKGKNKSYDNVYTNNSNENEQEKDKLKSGVTVELRNGNTVVKSTTTNSSGKYTFESVAISELENYSVVFKYNGLDYTSVILKNTNTTNESRAKEIRTERETLNGKYSKINNSKSTTLASSNAIISASTTEAGISLKTLYDNELNENVNLGLRSRTRPDLSLKEYLAAVIIEANGSKVVYSYQKNKEEQDGGAFDVGVDFGKFTGKSPYYATVYKSDVQSTIQLETTMNVWMVYQINVINESSNLKERIYSVNNYYDKNYDIISVGNVFENGDVVANSGTKYTAWNENSTILVDGTELKTTTISFNNNNGTDLENNGDTLSTYIKYKVSDSAVRGLLNQNETLYNASEINMYETYYKESTFEGSAYVENNGTVTCSLNNQLYAGLDESTPGNISLAIRNGKLTYTNENIIEDDTGMAPSLILEAQGSRTVEGTVWEDTTEYVANKGRFGNGLLENGENKISNVKVELLNNENKVVKLSDGTDAVTYTNDNGKYSFGVQNVVDGKYRGIVPGEYKIRFTYGEYIEESGIKKVSKINNIDMDAREYKSTIITKQNEAFKNNASNKWYVIGKNQGYSDAYDVINPINNDTLVNNSNYNSNITMVAYTPLMKIDLEHELEDQLDINNPTQSGNKFNIICSGIDFGIAERARIKANVDKKITNIKIISNNGNILAEGNPSEQANISFVKAFAELVSAEIDTELLSGATAEVEYSIVITNNSEIDYNDTNYYLYGPNAVNLNNLNAKKVKLEITKLVDYLGEGMQLDPNKDNSIWHDATLSTSEIRYVEESILDDVNAAKNDDGSAKYIIKETNLSAMQPGDSLTVKMNTSKLLSASKDGLRYENHVEILEYKGTNGRVIHETIPGNYNPVEGGTGIDESGIQKTESDDSKAVFLITDPTGIKINRMNYTLTTLIALTIILLGVVLIKKRIIIIEIVDDNETGKSQGENK